MTRYAARRHNLRVDLSNRFLAPLCTSLFTAGITTGAVRAHISGLSRRMGKVEEKVDQLPNSYVPRSEVQAGLKYLTDMVAEIRRSLDAYIAGRSGHWSGSLLASAESYDPVSEQRLALVHPDLARRVHAAMDALAPQGTFFRVAQGLRTYAEQDALYAQGRTMPGHVVTNAGGGWSNHNFGCAVDCFPFLSGRSGEINFDNHTKQFMAMVAALKAEGLVWGGDWHSLQDPPHFQLAQVPVTPTDGDRAVFARGGLKAVWAQYTPTIHAAAETEVSTDLVPFTIRFIADHSFISAAIREVTFSDWSHVEMLTPEKTWLGAHADGGVEERPYDYTTPARERRYDVLVTREQYARMLAKARGMVGTQYNYVGCFGIAIHHGLTQDGRLFCSMMIFEVAWEGGVGMINVLPGRSNLVTPEELHLSNLLIDHCTYQFPESAS